MLHHCKLQFSDVGLKRERPYLCPMKKWNAFIFDLNGTMVNDMEYHLNGWFKVLNDDLKADLSRDGGRSQRYGKNEELLDRVFGKGHFTKEQADKIALEKEKRYQAEFRPHLELIPGLAAFLQKAKDAHIRMAIGSAAIPFNIDFVLDNLSIRQYFSAVISADHVTISKPHPETFLKAAAALGVAPEDCLVFEDAPKGVEAANNAGMKCIVLTTMHPAAEFRDYPNVIRFIPDYTDLLPEELLHPGN
jgi:beta-phosphoglucomutase